MCPKMETLPSVLLIKPRTHCQIYFLTLVPKKIATCTETIFCTLGNESAPLFPFPCPCECSRNVWEPVRAFDGGRCAKKSSVSTMRLGGFCVRPAVRRSFLTINYRSHRRNSRARKRDPLRTWLLCVASWSGLLPHGGGEGQQHRSPLVCDALRGT